MWGVFSCQTRSTFFTNHLALAEYFRCHLPDSFNRAKVLSCAVYTLRLPNSTVNLLCCTNYNFRPDELNHSMPSNGPNWPIHLTSLHLCTPKKWGYQNWSFTLVLIWINWSDHRKKGHISCRNLLLSGQFEWSNKWCRDALLGWLTLFASWPKVQWAKRLKSCLNPLNTRERERERGDEKAEAPKSLNHTIDPVHTCS